MIIIPTEKRLDWQHAPIVLFFIVLLNVLVFVLYQSGDDVKYEASLDTYLELDLLDTEWPIYEKYLEEKNATDQLDEYRDYFKHQDFDVLAYYILKDEAFNAYLDNDKKTWTVEQELTYPFEQRYQLQQLLFSVSALKYGLIPDQLHPITLITHQFLHGGMMHLLGNLFFLVLCGFAVEAAIGHLRFLLFYLLSGITGGLLFAVLDLSSTTPLVGASGAISGVMAMYVAIFRLKKIEFFYWLFVFVGYFRAPALFVLPFYIGKELIAYFTETDSNVAFMAHTGGFIAGSILIAITLRFKPQTVNEEYIEEDQTIDPKQEQLAKIYQHIEKYQFTAAAKELEAYIAQFGKRFDLQLLQFHLLRIHKPVGFDECVQGLLKSKPVDDQDRAWLATIWQQAKESGNPVDTDTAVKLAINLTTQQHIALASSICRELIEQNAKHPSLGVLARRLAFHYESSGDKTQAREYNQLADQLLGGKLA